MKKVKVVFAAIVVFVMAMAITGCGSTNSEPFDADSFISDVAAAQSAIMDNAKNVASLANYEGNYWNAMSNVGGQIDYQRMTDAAFEWLQEKGGASKSDIEDAHSDICSSYKSIVAANVEGGLSEEVYSEYKNLYSAYDGLYRLATSPSGSRDSFVSEYNDYVTALNSSDSKLTTLVSD